MRQSRLREETAREEAEDQRALLQDLFEQVPIAMGLFEGPEQRISLANSEMCDIWGRSPEQVLGLSLLKALPELEGQHFDKLIADVFHTRVPFVGTEVAAQLFRLGRLETCYFNFVYQPLYNEQGKVLGVLDVAVEVTEQVKARFQVQELNEELQTINEELQASNEELLQTQQALQQLNEQLEMRVAKRTQEVLKAQVEADRQRIRLERLFMQAPAAICILSGPDLVFELVNPGYQQLFPGRSLLGKPVREALPEIVGQPIEAILDQVFQTGEPCEGRELLVPLSRSANGPIEDLYFNFVYQARYAENEQIDGLLAFAFEVTEQVKARNASEASALQLRLITDSLPVLIGYLDREEKYRFANQAYETWFQQKPENLLGRPVREVVGETAYQGVKKYIERALKGERLDFEATVPYREGFTKHIRTSYVPDLQNEKIAGFYTLVQDITHKVEARQTIEKSERQATSLAASLLTTNEELHQTNQQLVRVNVDLDNFIYTASHDLKAPILNIEGLMEALVD